MLFSLEKMSCFRAKFIMSMRGGGGWRGEAGWGRDTVVIESCAVGHYIVLCACARCRLSEKSFVLFIHGRFAA